MLRKSFVFVLGFGLVTNCTAQTLAPISKNSLALRRRCEALTPQDQISVVRVGAEEEFGTYVSHSDDGFTMYDIDLKREIILPYDEVKRIKNGYGGSVNHRHTDPSHKWVVIGITVAVFGTLLVLLATAKN